MWDLVAVVQVEHRPLHHREAQVHIPPCVVEQVHVGLLDFALLGEGHLVAAEEGMSAAADSHLRLGPASATTALRRTDLK